MAIRAHAGELRTWISIEQDTPTQDAGGGEVHSWAELASVPARMRALRGDERFVGDQHIGKTIYTFVIREPSVAVTKKMRINLSGRIFEIISGPMPLPDGRFLELMAEERD